MKGFAFYKAFQSGFTAWGSSLGVAGCVLFENL